MNRDTLLNVLSAKEGSELKEDRKIGPILDHCKDIAKRILQVDDAMTLSDVYFRYRDNVYHVDAHSFDCTPIQFARVQRELIRFLHEAGCKDIVYLGMVR